MFFAVDFVGTLVFMQERKNNSNSENQLFSGDDEAVYFWRLFAVNSI